MKRIILICIFLVVLVGFCVYIEVSTRDFVDSLPKVPTSKASDKPQVNAVRSDTPATAKPVPSFDSEYITENTENDTAAVKSEIPTGLDWTDDEAARENLEKDSSDPFSDYLVLQEAIERGTLITADTSGEELYNAIYHQTLERFGDIPEVHTVMEFRRKFESDAPISLEERIEYQEALVKLYPGSTNEKTLAYYKWLYPRGNSPEDIGDINPEAIAELRSMGISVKEEQTENGYSVKISTR
jgi:hypothetical protein